MIFKLDCAVTNCDVSRERRNWWGWWEWVSHIRRRRRTVCLYYLPTTLPKRSENHVSRSYGCYWAAISGSNAPFHKLWSHILWKVCAEAVSKNVTVFQLRKADQRFVRFQLGTFPSMRYSHIFRLGAFNVASEHRQKEEKKTKIAEDSTWSFAIAKREMIHTSGHRYENWTRWDDFSSFVRILASGWRGQSTKVPTEVSIAATFSTWFSWNLPIFSPLLLCCHMLLHWHKSW